MLDVPYAVGKRRDLRRSKSRSKSGTMGVLSVARKMAAATKEIEMEGADSPMEDWTY